MPITRASAYQKRLPSIAPPVPLAITPHRLSGPWRRANAGDRHDHLRRDRRKDRLEEHQQEDADIAGLLDQPDRPVAHSGSARASLRSRPRSAPGVSVPLNLSIATMPVGEVTLISVSHLPPITSMPTNSSPRALSSGPSAAQISLLGLGQLGLRRDAADGEVRADLALARDPVDRAGHLAVDRGRSSCRPRAISGTKAWTTCGSR